MTRQFQPGDRVRFTRKWKQNTGSQDRHIYTVIAAGKPFVTLDQPLDELSLRLYTEAELLANPLLSFRHAHPNNLEKVRA